MCHPISRKDELNERGEALQRVLNELTAQADVGGSAVRSCCVFFPGHEKKIPLSP